MSDGWWPAVGDPTVVGWVTVLAYLVVAVLSVANALRARDTGTGAGFWLGLAALAAVLGVNKQLDLQSLLTQTGRQLATAHGWYEQRRTMQAVFIGLLATSAVAAAWSVFRRTAKPSGDGRVAAAGVVGLLGFIVLRAATFHHLGDWLSIDGDHPWLNVAMELGALGVIAVGCWTWFYRHSPR